MKTITFTEEQLVYLKDMLDTTGFMLGEWIETGKDREEDVTNEETQLGLLNGILSQL